MARASSCRQPIRALLHAGRVEVSTGYKQTLRAALHIFVVAIPASAYDGTAMGDNFTSRLR